MVAHKRISAKIHKISIILRIKIFWFSFSILTILTRDVSQSEKIWNTELQECWNNNGILGCWNIKKIFSSCFSDTKLYLVPNYDWLLNESGIIWYLNNKN